VSRRPLQDGDRFLVLRERIAILSAVRQSGERGDQGYKILTNLDANRREKEATAIGKGRNLSGALSRAVMGGVRRPGGVLNGEVAREGGAVGGVDHQVEFVEALCVEVQEEIKLSLHICSSGYIVSSTGDVDLCFGSGHSAEGDLAYGGGRRDLGEVGSTLHAFSKTGCTHGYGQSGRGILVARGWDAFVNGLLEVGNPLLFPCKEDVLDVLRTYGRKLFCHDQQLVEQGRRLFHVKRDVVGPVLETAGQKAGIAVVYLHKAQSQSAVLYVGAKDHGVGKLAVRFDAQGNGHRRRDPGCQGQPPLLQRIAHAIEQLGIKIRRDSQNKTRKRSPPRKIDKRSEDFVKHLSQEVGWSAPVASHQNLRLSFGGRAPEVGREESAKVICSVVIKKTIESLKIPGAFVGGKRLAKSQSSVALKEESRETSPVAQRRNLWTRSLAGPG